MKISAILVGAYLTFLVKISDRYAIWKNKFMQKNEASLVDLPSHTLKENRTYWNSYDWSKGGEEWTADVKRYREIDPNLWKNSLINEIMLKYIKKDSSILEVGAGAGRWSEILQPLAKKLILVDISKKCIEICQKRFENCNNVQFHLIKKGLDMIEDNSIEYIWSYDVFVHINPTDIERYIEDFYRILKPGGYALIHHAGTYNESDLRQKGFRTTMDGNTFGQFVKKNKMMMVEQNTSLPHLPGDVISIFAKPISISYEQ